MSQLTEFKRELRELLEKHGASIEVGYADCSDTHGMYDEHMAVSFKGGKSHRISEFGWGLDAGDLK